MLVTLRALGGGWADSRADRLASEVDALAPTRTTFVSAALLKHAGRGECVPELAAVLAAPSRETFDALLRVGHSSGRGLALGVFTALWMAGGVTHIDSFDPKPQAPVEIRGTLTDIATSMPGVRFCEPVKSRPLIPTRRLIPAATSIRKRSIRRCRPRAA